MRHLYHTIPTPCLSVYSSEWSALRPTFRSLEIPGGMAAPRPRIPQVHLAPKESPGHLSFLGGHHDWQGTRPSQEWHPVVEPAPCLCHRSCRPKGKHEWRHSPRRDHQPPFRCFRAKGRSHHWEHSPPNPWQSHGGRFLESGAGCKSYVLPGTSRVNDRHALKDEEWQVAGIQSPGLFMAKAGGAGQQHEPKSRQVDHFVLRDLGHHQTPQVVVSRGYSTGAPLPQANRPSRYRHPRLGWGPASSIRRPCFSPIATLADESGKSPLARLAWVHVRTRSKQARSLSASAKNNA